MTFLETVQSVDGISGREQVVVDTVLRELGPCVDSVWRDDIGNGYLLKHGREPGQATVMIAAHADEIGFMVHAVDDRGFVRLRAVGGIDSRLLLAQEVSIHASGSQNEITKVPGIIGVKPPHLLHPDERDRTIPIEELFVDTGLSAETAKSLIRVGDMVTLRSPLLRLQGGKMTGKSLDNRVGLAVQAAVLESLGDERPGPDMLLVATAQEEVGLHGARTSSYRIQPDAGIAVDVGFGRQHGVGADEGFDLGSGPVLAHGPGNHPELLRHLLETARAEQIPHQEEAFAYSEGTDAGAIQVSGWGIPAALISVPIRYMHGPVEVVQEDDIRSAGRLLASLLRRLDPLTVKGWKTCNR